MFALIQGSLQIYKSYQVDRTIPTKVKLKSKSLDKAYSLFARMIEQFL